MTTSQASAMSAETGDLLSGAVDFHVHGYPDVAESYAGRGDDLVNICLAQSFGIGGWVLKSHLWPTMDRARLLKRALGDSDFELFASITLNPLVGGVDAAVVEAAAAHGARVVFLPTWGASNDRAHGAYVASLMARYMPSMERFIADRAITVTDPDGQLIRAAKDVVRACQALDLVLCTGHVSLAEVRAVADFAEHISYRKLVATHAHGFAKSVEELVELADHDVAIEFTNLTTFLLTGGPSFQDVYEAIVAVGPSRSIISTDVFSPWVPPEAECLRMFVEQLREMGCPTEDIRSMVHDNPRRLLGMPTRRDTNPGPDGRA